MASPQDTRDAVTCAVPDLAARNSCETVPHPEPSGAEQDWGEVTPAPTGASTREFELP